MANRRVLLGAVLAVVIVIILAGVTAYYLTLPPAGSGGTPSASTCTGSKSYSGTVQNDTGVPVPGAVVSLAATPPNVGTNATATTDASGAWSASVSSVCAYTARVYWQSTVDSPLLARIVNVTASSTIPVHVSWENVTLTLLAELPHDANASVSVSIPDGFSFFVQANSSGSIPLGFLPTDAAGSPGYGFSMNATAMNQTGSIPYAVIRPAARAYWVQDANGNSVVYAVPLLQASFGSMGITDPLNMTTAIAQVQARGGNPYISVAARSGMTIPFNVTNATHMFVGETTGVFGVSLETYVTVRTNSTLELGLSVELVNSTNRTQCYVVDPEGAQIHTWYYGVGTCP